MTLYQQCWLIYDYRPIWIALIFTGLKPIWAPGSAPFFSIRGFLFFKLNEENCGHRFRPFWSSNDAWIICPWFPRSESPASCCQHWLEVWWIHHQKQMGIDASYSKKWINPRIYSYGGGARHGMEQIMLISCCGKAALRLMEYHDCSEHMLRNGKNLKFFFYFFFFRLAAIVSIYQIMKWLNETCRFR